MANKYLVQIETVVLPISFHKWCYLLGVSIVNGKGWTGHFLRTDLTVCSYVPQHLVKQYKQYLLIELWMIWSTYLKILLMTKVLVKRNFWRVRSVTVTMHSWVVSCMHFLLSVKTSSIVYIHIYVFWRNSSTCFSVWEFYQSGLMVT